MQVSVESTGNLERRMTFQVPAEQLESSVGGRLREMARTARIKGFRPGKVPPKVIEQRFGQQVRAEVLEQLLRQEFDKAVQANELRLAGSPRIEPENEEGLAYVATFEVVPDFGDIDVGKLEVVRHAAQVEESDIDRMIENLRLQRRSWTVVNRPAQQGDAVSIAIWSQVGDERIPAEGAERSVAVVGAGSLFGELERALAGMSGGEEKVLEIAFPADWRVPALAGKTIGFIDNAKPNFNLLVDDLAELFVSRYGVAHVIKRAKRGASMPAPESIVNELAEQCVLVITGSGD